jgi:GNAT superfamily N-acetyltransferase
MHFREKINQWLFPSYTFQKKKVAALQHLLDEFTGKLDVKKKEALELIKEIENIYVILKLKSHYRCKLLILPKLAPLMLAAGQKAVWSDFVVYLPRFEQNEIAKSYVWTKGEDLIIEDILVYEPYRNHGIGTALLQEIAIEARWRRCTRITGQFIRNEHIQVDRLVRFFNHSGYTVTVSADGRTGQFFKELPTNS